MHKIAILASGNGSNAENIVRRFHDGNAIRTVVVVSDHADAGVHERMHNLGVETITLPAEVWKTRPAEVIDLLESHGVEMVVLAGFMRKVHPAIVEMYDGRMLNLHPSLLPAYGGKGMYGHHVHEAVIAAGEKRSGATVHYVTDIMDGGEILMQGEVEVTPDDTPATLEAKVHEVEFDIYPRAIVKAFDRLDREAAKATEHTENIEKKATASPTPPPTPHGTQNEQWAEVLKVDYDAEEAARRATNAETRASISGPSNTPAPRQRPPQYHSEPMPPTYLLWAVVMTVFCCLIPGIIAIIYSSQVSSKYLAGDIEGARRASRRAEGWIIASFVLGVLSATLYLPLTLISGF